MCGPCGRNYFYTCLVFAIGTILQTGAHLVVVVSALYMTVCETTPKDSSTIFFYITYLYKKECGPLEVSSNHHWTSFLFPGSTQSNLDQLVEDILNLAEFPNSSPLLIRTWIYILTFIVLDAVWIVTAVALLLGVCLKLKQTFGIIFYGPWLVVTACVLCFDIIASIHFGLDLFQLTSLSNWVKFTGILNPNDLNNLDQKYPVVVPVLPTFYVLSLSSRGIVFWIWNMVGFIFIGKATLNAYRASYQQEKPAQRQRSESDQIAQDLDLDSSAARIRSWQLFYGTIASSTSSQSSNSSNQNSNSNNNNNNNRSTDDSKPRFVEEPRTIQRSLELPPADIQK